MPSEKLSATSPGERLHPLSLVFGIGTAAWAVIALMLFSSIKSPLLIMLFLLPAIATSILRYISFRFWLGPDEMVIREGILRRNERHIPYARIQNIDRIQNLFHRLFKVAVVRLETASGGKPEAVISVLPLKTVEAMRDHVFRERIEKAAAAADDTADDDAGLLLKLPVKELAIFGAISNKGMVVVAAALGLAGQSGYFDNPEWVSDLLQSDIVTPQVSASQLASGPSLLWLVGLAMLGLLAIIVLLRIFSILWAILKFHGFRLDLLGDDLRAQYGLLTQVTATIPRHRIQLATVNLTPLHRWFGRASIQVDTAGGGGADPGRQGAVQERQWLAPVVLRQGALPLLRRAMPESLIERLDWQPISPRAWRRLFRRWLALLFVAVAIGLWLTGPWGLVLAVFGLPLAFRHSRLYARRTGYALTPTAVLYRSGCWIRRVSIVPFGKIQTLLLRQTPFDRRNAMATVAVDTAGASLSGHRVAIAYLDLDMARQVIARLDLEAGRTAFRW